MKLPLGRHPRSKMVFIFYYDQAFLVMSFEINWRRNRQDASRRATLKYNDIDKIVRKKI